MASRGQIIIIVKCKSAGLRRPTTNDEQPEGGQHI